MSDVPFVLPKEYGYVVLSGVVGSFIVNMYLSSRVTQARKKHDVKYPVVYAANDDKFNCVQRGHQHFLEVQPFFFVFQLIGGLQHPYICTAGALVYLLGRIFYFHGYATGDPAKRSRGFFGYAGFFACLGSAISFAVHLLM